tara:strand:- start:442 stop:828 length:387 start_codon:yes stop_codon:yes gene_type:complete
MIKPLRKKGQILPENVIFIILNLIFLSILIFFVYAKSGGEARLEENHAKQIALIIDSAKPYTEIHLNMKDAIEKADENNWKENIVSISGNTVTVKLREKGGYSYSFFNDVGVSAYQDKENYVIIVSER